MQQLAKSIVLSGRNGINDLVLDDTKVTAEGLNAFYDKVHASRLSVAGLSLSDEDLAQLAPKLNCGVLCLGDNPVTGQGLKHLWTYGRFYALHLNGCPLTNADLETLLSERPPDALTLNTLNLAGTQVDDAGVETLTKLRILALLILSPNQISEEGLSRLRQRWPELRIQFQLNPKQKLLYLDGTQRTPSVTPTST